MVTTLDSRTIGVGIVEGLADSLTLAVKIFSGTLSDSLSKSKSWLSAAMRSEHSLNGSSPGRPTSAPSPALACWIDWAGSYAEPLATHLYVFAVDQST